MSQGQCRIHVEMAVDEGRRNQEASSIDDLAGFRDDLGLDRRDAPRRDGHVLSNTPVGKRRVADDEVEGHEGLVLISMELRWRVLDRAPLELELR
jgi:hypothetical protein